MLLATSFAKPKRADVSGIVTLASGRRALHPCLLLGHPVLEQYRTITLPRRFRCATSRRVHQVHSGTPSTAFAKRRLRDVPATSLLCFVRRDALRVRSDDQRCGGDPHSALDDDVFWHCPFHTRFPEFAAVIPDSSWATVNRPRARRIFANAALSGPFRDQRDAGCGAGRRSGLSRSAFVPDRKWFGLGIRVARISPGCGDSHQDNNGFVSADSFRSAGD